MHGAKPSQFSRHVMSQWCLDLVSVSMQVLPIFILSIADFLLACTWIVGGTMWFAEVSNRSWCFVPSLLTVVSVKAVEY